jgi:purine nucleosidase
LKKIILDCDPGVDDALAIVLALNSGKIELEGITTVNGNVGVEQTFLNARRILDYFEIDIPVARGASRPLKVAPIHAESFHGNDGLGDSRLLPPGAKPRPKQKNAVDFLIQSVASGLRTIVATGPLTNIALAFQKDAKVMEQLEELVIMGGAIHEHGNVDTVSEFNFYADPDAADYVFRTKIPKVLVPLDATHRALPTPSAVRKIKDTPSGKFGKSVLAKYLHAELAEGNGGAHLHDPLAMGYAIDKSFVRVKSAFIRVETQGKYTRGACVVEERPWVKSTPNAKYAWDVDSKRFVEYFVDTVSK